VLPSVSGRVKKKVACGVSGAMASSYELLSRDSWMAYEMTQSATFAMGVLGLIMFLSCIGLSDSFIETRESHR
jgi:hypothetical protein